MNSDHSTIVGVASTLRTASWGIQLSLHASRRLWTTKKPLKHLKPNKDNLQLFPFSLAPLNSWALTVQTHACLFIAPIQSVLDNAFSRLQKVTLKKSGGTLINLFTFTYRSSSNPSCWIWDLIFCPDVFSMIFSRRWKSSWLNISLSSNGPIIYKKAGSTLLGKGYIETKFKDVLNKYSSPVLVGVNCLGWY